MKLSNFKLICIYFLTSLVFFSCKDDGNDPGPTITEDPTASFQIEYSETDFRVVTFNNFSQRATAYSWAFGDGETSTEENPTHTYAEEGDYEVVLTASNAEGKTHTSLPKTVTITDPNSAIKDLTGDVQKVWKLSRNVEKEFACIVGPADRTTEWWTLGVNQPYIDRKCSMEAEFIFGADGTYTYKTNGMVYAIYNYFVGAEERFLWGGDAAGNCVDETDSGLMTSANGDDLTPWGSGEHTFEYNASESKLTVIGLGAYIGLPQVGTNVEVGVPQASVTYNITKLDTVGPIDKMQLEIDMPEGKYWQFNLVSYENPDDEPELEAALPAAGFASTTDGNMVSFTNVSTNADSYMWDFGDGNTSTEENPTHTFTDDGSYNVILTASNADGSSTASETIIISVNSSFGVNTLFGEESKTWKLAPIAGALKVGNGIGGSNFWANTLEDVTARACGFDDTYSFNKEGIFEYNANGEVWGEAYMGVDPAGCIAESEVGADAKAWTSATHSYTLAETSGDELALLTVSGTGAFIALPKAFNGGEYGTEKEAPPTPDGSVTYDVVQYVNDGSAELLVLAIKIGEDMGGPVYWTFTLVTE